MAEEKKKRPKKVKAPIKETVGTEKPKEEKKEKKIVKTVKKGIGKVYEGSEVLSAAEVCLYGVKNVEVRTFAGQTYVMSMAEFEALKKD